MSFRIRRLEERREPRFRRVRKLLALAFLALQPLYALGRKFQEKREREQRSKRMIAMGVAVVVAASIVLLTLSLLLRVGALSLSSILERTGTPLTADEEGRTNILLLGQGDETHEGIDLTDAILVASMDPSTPLRSAQGDTASVILLSLPRDLYFLHTEEMQLGKGKLNSLWRDERILLQRQGRERGEAAIRALRALSKEVGAALGIPLHYAVKVDFTAFEEAIDALGGIDVEVPETIHDPEFPGPNYAFETFHIDAGPQHLDGHTALKYTRTRSTSSDFDRSARQQQILRAAAKQAQEEGLFRNPTKLLELTSALSKHIETDLTTRELLTLAHIGMQLSQDRVVAMQLSDRNGLYETPLFPGGLLYAPPRDLFEGASVLLPVSIPEFPVTWKQLRVLTTLLFRHREFYLPAPRPVPRGPAQPVFDSEAQTRGAGGLGEGGQKPRIAVLNAGAPEGTARRVARELIKFGFEVSSVSNFPGKQEVAKSFIAHNTPEAQAFAIFFSSLLSLPQESLHAPPDPQAFGDLTIVLGKDFHFQYFQDLLSR